MLGCSQYHTRQGAVLCRDASTPAKVLENSRVVPGALPLDCVTNLPLHVVAGDAEGFRCPQSTQRGGAATKGEGGEERRRLEILQHSCAKNASRSQRKVIASRQSTLNTIDIIVMSAKMAL